MGAYSLFFRKVELSSYQSFQSFRSLNLPEPLLDDLEAMGFETPTPIQAATIPAALEGRDILGCAPTGTGKTGAFGVPLLSCLYPEPDHQALILAPTRELAAQIHRVLKEMSRGLKLRGALLVGGESYTRQVDAVERGVDYFVATPGRLIDHLREGLRLERIRILVLDEVDRMLDMGFAPQLRTIMAKVPGKRQTLLFSATLPREILTMVDRLMTNPVRATIGSSSEPVAQVVQETIETTHQKKNELLLEQLKGRDGRILIFVRTKDGTDHLTRWLSRHGFRTAKLHGGCTQGHRKQALEGFRKGSPRIMVATDLAGRGIDVADIEHVINYDLPATREDYIHRIGRTGRLGKPGTAVNFLTPEDVDGRHVISGTKPPARVVFSSKRWRSRR